MAFSFDRRCSRDWGSLAMIAGVVLVVGLLAAWLIAEFVCTRSFVGTLVGKHDEVSYQHDERETTVSTDSDGDVSVSTSGDNETIAIRTYILTFFVEDRKMRPVKVGTQRARVPYVRADAMALQKLNAEAVEPAFYTHGQLRRQYLVKVSGWLIDGTVTEMIDIATMNTE